MKFIILLSVIMAVCNAMVSFRSDQVGGPIKSKAPRAGALWEGEWTEAKYCNPGYYAFGFGYYDPASTPYWFILLCYSPTENELDAVGAIETPFYKLVSDRLKVLSCVGEDATKPSYITGFKINQDNENNFRSFSALCNDGENYKTLRPPTTTSLTHGWGELAQCGARQSVCGFRQQVHFMDLGGAEKWQYPLGVELYCCQTELVLSKPVGYWTRVAGFGGGGGAEATFTYGVTNHKQEDLTSEFHNEVTKAVSAGVSFEAFGVGGSAEVSLSSTASSTMASTMSQSVTTSMEQSITLSCPEDDAAMYQWVTRINENVVTDSFNFEIKSKDIWCVSDDKLIPQCPFGFCANEDCQKCDEGWKKSN